MNQNQELLIFFKAMGDANRLKIAGLLAKQPYTVEQLAALLGLGASTVSHHLAKLTEAGLVSARAQSYYNVYQLETERVEEMARRLLSGDSLPAAAADIDVDAYDHKVVNDYLLPDGHLKTIPSQRKKLLAILRYMIQDFSPGVRYSEKEINEILARYHEDTASLRRELISAKLLDRETGGTAYWRTETSGAGE